MDATTSALRRQLWRHFRASGSLLRQMTQPAELIPGSFYLMRRKCGKPSCRCAKGHLHATYVLTRSEAGKHKLYSVPPDQRARCSQIGRCLETRPESPRSTPQIAGPTAGPCRSDRPGPASGLAACGSPP